jgi:hypothetical protein
MTIIRARAARLGLVTCLAVGSWLLPVTARAEIPLQSSVAVTAGNGLTGFSHVTPIGSFTIMEVSFTFESFGFLDARNADSIAAVDVYVGAVLPDGRFMSWAGDPFASTFVTGQAPVPLFAAVVPAVGTQYFYRHLSFATGAAQGWYVLYGLVVRAGANPLDPREWGGWNPAAFYPFLVIPLATPSP